MEGVWDNVGWLRVSVVFKGGMSLHVWEHLADNVKHMGTVSRAYLALHILHMSKLSLTAWFRSCVASYVWGRKLS